MYNSQYLQNAGGSRPVNTDPKVRFNVEAEGSKQCVMAEIERPIHVEVEDLKNRIATAHDTLSALERRLSTVVIDSNMCHPSPQADAPCPPRSPLRNQLVTCNDGVLALIRRIETLIGGVEI